MFVTPSAVLAVDRFVGASGNSHVKKDVGVLDCGLYMCSPCRPVATCEWMAQRCSLQLTRICIKAIFFLPLSDTVVCGCSRTAMCAKFHGRAQSRVRFIPWRGRQIADETLSRIRRCRSLTMTHVRVLSESQRCDRPAHDAERTVLPIHRVEWCDGPQCDVSLAMVAEVCSSRF